MKPTLSIIAAGAALTGTPLSAQIPPTEPTPEAAQQLLANTLPAWGRLSTDALAVHYPISSVGPANANCGTNISYGGTGRQPINWREVGGVTFRNLERSRNSYLVKITLPSDRYVQLYFSSTQQAERVLAAANYLKAYCDPSGGVFG